MLQSIRDKAKGGVFMVLVGIIALTFVLFGTGTFRDLHVLDAAKVGDRIISVSQVQRALNQNLQGVDRSSVNASDLAVLREQVMSQLINQTQMVTMGQSLGLTSHDQLFNELIMQVPAFFDNGQFSVERFRTVLSQAEFTPTSFRAQFDDDTVLQQLLTGLTQSEFILDREAAQFANDFFEKRDVRYATVPLTPFTPATVDEGVVKAYYDEHPAQFMSNDNLDLEAIVLRVDDFKSQVSVTDDAIEAHYQANLESHITQPEKIKVAHILIESKDESKKSAIINDIQEALSAGQSFSSLAAKFSEDDLSKEKGGVIGWIKRDELVPELSQAAFRLTEEYPISEPIETVYGTHILKWLGYQPENIEPLDAVKATVQDSFVNHKARELWLNQADKLSDLAFEAADELASVAEVLGVHSQVFNNVDSENGQLVAGTDNTLPDYMTHPVVTGRVMEAIAEQNQSNSETIQLNEDIALVFRIKRLTPSAVKPFELVKSEVEAFSKREIALEKRQSYIDLWQKNEPPVEGEGLALVLKPLQGLQRHREPGVPQHWMTAMFEQPAIKGQRYAENLADGTALLWVVDSFEPGKLDSLSETERKQFEQGILQTQQMQSLHLIEQYAEKTVPVKVYWDDASA